MQLEMRGFRHVPPMKTFPRSISGLLIFHRPFVELETSRSAARRSDALVRSLQCLSRRAFGRTTFLRFAALLLAGLSSVVGTQAQNLATPYGVYTLAGVAGSAGSTDGTGSAGMFANPSDVAVDAAGDLYIADTGNNTLRKVTLQALPENLPGIPNFNPVGVVTTIAGQAGVSGSSDGSATAATFNHPAGVAVDGVGIVYVADTDNNEIRMVTAAGVVSTLAGQAGHTGSADGSGSSASFNGPSGIVADSQGNLYVADTLNHTIRKVTSAGAVTTIAGTAGASGFVDGTGSSAKFHGPQGLALDGSGDLFVADTNNNAIRKIVTATGVVTTVAGQSGIAGSIDGAVSQAQFHYPSGITVDTAGNLYIADTDNHTLREIAPAGTVSTLAGLAGSSGSADGVGTAARFNFPTGVYVDGLGNVSVADTSNDTIRVAFVPAPPVITQQPLSSATVTPGQSVTLSVGATGGPLLSYSWIQTTTNSDGLTVSINVSGNRIYTIPSVQTYNAGNYACIVTNSSGDVTSSTAELQVIPEIPVTTGGSSSSGGGGGGAPSAWFYGMLSLLALVRRAWVARIR